MKRNNGVILIGSVVRPPKLNPGKNLIFTVGGIILDSSGRESSFFHEVIVPGKRADEVASRLTVDQAVAVHGTLIESTWEHDGQKRSKVQVKTFDVETLYREKGDENYLSDAQGALRLRDARAAVWIIGNVGGEPQVSESEHGKIVRARVAINERQGEEKVTHWFSVVAYDDHALVLEQVRRGDRLLVEGTLASEGWTDKDGNKRSSTSIKAQRVEFIAAPEAAAAEDA